MDRSSDAATRQTSRLFSHICRDDLVTIRDGAGERKGHAVKWEYGNWVLILERNAGTALATRENTIALSRPKKLPEVPKVGQRLVYDDGGKRAGEVSRSVQGQCTFCSRAVWSRPSSILTTASGWTISPWKTNPKLGYSDEQLAMRGALKLRGAIHNQPPPFLGSHFVRLQQC